jgi:hypothetical protein
MSNVNSNSSEWMDPLQFKKDGAMNVQVPDLEKLFELDPYLKDHEREIRRRYIFIIFKIIK